MSNYLPTHQWQGHLATFPHPYPAWYVDAGWTYEDCWVRVSSWMIDGYTVGKDIPDPWTIRQEVHKIVPNPTYYELHTSIGPGGPDDVDNACAAHNVPFSWAIRNAQDAQSLIETPSDEYIWVATDFRSWEGRRCQPDFQGKHALGIIPGADNKHRVLVMDPVCQGYFKADISGIINSMLLYGKDHGHEGEVYIGHTGPKAPCPPGKIRDPKTGDCVPPPNPTDTNPEPWYNTQEAQGIVAVNSGISIILVVVAVVLIAGIYIAVKASQGSDKVVDRGETG